MDKPACPKERMHFKRYIYFLLLNLYRCGVINLEIHISATPTLVKMVSVHMHMQICLSAYICKDDMQTIFSDIGPDSPVWPSSAQGWVSVRKLVICPLPVSPDLG